jgi:hypothetical protein
MSGSRSNSSIAVEHASIGWSIPIAVSSLFIFAKWTDFTHAHHSLPRTAQY